MTRTLVGNVGDLVSLIPLGATAFGDHPGLRYPLIGEPLLVGRTRGVSNVKTDDIATVTLERGRLLVIETLLQSGHDRRGPDHAPRPPVAWPSSSPTRPALSTISPGSAAVGPSCTYPKDDTLAATPRPASSATRQRVRGNRRRRLGRQQGLAASHKRFREKFELPFTLLGPGARGHRPLRGVGEKTALGRTYMGIIRSTFLIDPDGRIARLAEGQGGRPPGRGAGRARRGAGRPRRGMTEEAPEPAPAEAPHDWRPARFMVIAAHPDDADFGRR